MAAKPAARDGKWWASADTDRRDGFFWGAGDCLGAEAHIPHSFFGTSRGFNSDAFDKEVSRFYADHPRDSKLPVIEVWRKVGPQIGRDSPHTKGGEVYKGDHGFLDGLWYRGASYSDRLGFLEGYTECLRHYVAQPSATYSRPVTYYDDKIWDYVAAHPAADEEAIATMLFRYRDKPKP